MLEPVLPAYHHSMDSHANIATHLSTETMV